MRCRRSYPPRLYDLLLGYKARLQVQMLTNCLLCSSLFFMNFRVLMVHDFSAMVAGVEAHTISFLLKDCNTAHSTPMPALVQQSHAAAAPGCQISHDAVILRATQTLLCSVCPESHVLRKEHKADALGSSCMRVSIPELCSRQWHSASEARY